MRGDSGVAVFRQAILEYADRSIAILKRTDSQGMIVWDLEGEQFPHKITYVGDPRLLKRLAPEAEAAADEFFARFRRAGLRVGLTLRPQQLSFSAEGKVSQADVENYERLLIDKIDYAQSRWGATLFYIDSNGGPRWPGEAVRLHDLALQRPGILLIPEHHDVLYYGFSAPYGSMQRGDRATPGIVRWLYPNGFRVLAVADSNTAVSDLEATYRGGDILLFPAWFDNPSSRAIETFAAPGGRSTGMSGTARSEK